MNQRPFSLKSLKRILLVAFAGLTPSLSGCQQTPVHTKTTTDWIHHPVSEGIVCTQSKGIYSRTQAEQLAIENCLLQLTDKRISGQSNVTKSTMVYKNQHGERVQTTASAVNHFQVKNAQTDAIAYQVLGKHYDPTTETLFVWIKLK